MWDLGKLIVAKGFKKLPSHISGHTAHYLGTITTSQVSGNTINNFKSFEIYKNKHIFNIC